MASVSAALLSQAREGCLDSDALPSYYRLLNYQYQ
jgi:hypothetical protein